MTDVSVTPVKSCALARSSSPRVMVVRTGCLLGLATNVGSSDADVKADA
jgi:hypothetical protein